MKISLLVLRCKDIDASKHFYQQFGLVFQKEKHGLGTEHYACEHDGVVFELYPNKSEAPIDNTRFGFSVNKDIFTASDIPIENSYEINGKTVHIVIDPDGRKVEISSN